MKTIYLMLLTGSMFILNSCSKDDDTISYDLTGSWKVIYFKEGDSIKTKTEGNTLPKLNNGDNTANFSEPDGNGKGTITGITVTNGYNGNYTISEEGKISIGPITTTFINQPEWANKFKINAAENFEIRNSKLIIYYNDRNNAIVFERIRKPDFP